MGCGSCSTGGGCAPAGCKSNGACLTGGCQKMEVHEEMYGLKEIDFLKVAQKLDPATRKALENEE